jgi:hypothetical protein
MSDEQNAEFRRYRAEMIRGLVQIAGAETVTVRPVQGQTQGPTREERLGRLERALPSLEGCLQRFSDWLRNQFAAGPVRVPSGKELDRDRMIRLTEAARRRMARLLATVRTGDVDIDETVRKARGPLIRIVNKWVPIPKVFVAVHGIGDQFQNATVQTVAFRVCDYVGQPTAIPLGRFHAPGARVGVFLPEPGRDPNLDCGFAEIYWADVPRVPAAEKHTLEEPRKWARTLVERLRLTSHARPSEGEGGARLRPNDDPLGRKERAKDQRVEELLEEMIQGVTVAGRVSFLAEKAGLFRFDLQEVLNDFLNDVQVVTEFEEYREQLLTIFKAVMERISIYFPASEVYIVAHSEGTVVSFMGLLMGLYEYANLDPVAKQQNHWIKQVRGYMTIGSPLNKHVFFWPELFDQFRAAAPDPQNPLRPIPWKNYYDYGDPIANELGLTRDWLEKRQWAPYFTFTPADDIGFTRYYFPGEAHNEYWSDPEVFGHFIQTVVIRDDQPPERVLRSSPPDVQYDKPRTRFFAALLSYPLPYLLAAALMFVACFLLYEAVRGCLDPIGARFESHSEVGLNVLAIWGLIAGMSLLARIPYLGAHAAWWLLAVVLGVGYTFLYFGLSASNRDSIQQFLGSAGEDPYASFLYNIGLLLAAGLVVLLAAVLRPLWPTALTLAPVILWIVSLRVGFAMWGGAERPRLGDLPLELLLIASAALAAGLLALVWGLKWLASGRPRPSAPYINIWGLRWLASGPPRTLSPYLHAAAWVLAGLTLWLFVPQADRLYAGWISAPLAVIVLVLQAQKWGLRWAAPELAARHSGSIDAASWVLAAFAAWFVAPMAVTFVDPGWRCAALSAPLEGMAVLSVAWVLGLAAWAVSYIFPGHGTRPLVHTGGLILLLVVATQVIKNASSRSGTDRATAAKATDRYIGEIVKQRIKNLGEIEAAASAGRTPRMPPPPYDLELKPALTSVGQIPERSSGDRPLVVVADVGDSLHFRIFDADGVMIVNSDRDQLVGRLKTDPKGSRKLDDDLKDLRARLGELWPPHRMTRSEKDGVITAVAKVVGLTPPISIDHPIPQDEWPMILGAAGLDRVVAQSTEQGPIWPVLLAGAAFLYLWWLAIILFDLTFIWHLYIRWSGAEKLAIERLEQAGTLPTQLPPAAPARPLPSKGGPPTSPSPSPKSP